MDNHSRLTAHFNDYVSRKRAEWGAMQAEAGFKRHLLVSLDKWEALYRDVFLRDPRFLGIAEPFTPKTRVDPCQYYMRLDGSIVFTEGVFWDERGHMIAGYPLRFPYDPRARGQYLSHNIEPDIFGIRMKCVTKVFKDGKKNFEAQDEECHRIIRHQARGRNPILPLYYHRAHVDGENLQLVQTPIFRRDNFVFHFPFRKALDYCYHTLRFEPIVKGVDWLLSKAHTTGFWDLPPLKYEQLGCTGSTSFGDINDTDDCDIVFLGPVERLQKVRNFLYAGVTNGRFKSVSPYRRLRVHVPEERVACNHNKPMLLCTFQMFDDVRQDYLYGARFKILGKVDYFEAEVADDSWNMVVPPRVTLRNIRNVRAKRKIFIPENTLLVTMMGTCRGYYGRGDRIGARRSIYVEFTPYNGKPFRALVSTGWYDIFRRR
jgi:hypothetical protein